MHRLVATVLVLLACAPAGWAQDPSLPELEVQSEPEPREFVRPAAQISGGRILGFVVSGPGEVGVPPRLSASIPRDWAGEVACMRLTAADGLYEARATYGVPDDWPGGPAVLRFPWGRPEVLAAYPSEHLALAVSRGGCDAPVEEIAVAGLDAGPGVLAAPSAARLLVNSFRAEETLVFALDDPAAETVVCGRAEAPVRAEFDTACDLPADLLAGGAARLLVAPIRRGEMGEFPVVLRAAAP